ncbi:predicted protein [Botrytis cinerea T4]|uniref:Uncharacterized protein n=1 Tax=Botryotinia fuckeliana (strain T4) TaxID=999810 RepID=G2YNH6_BOTF4|nr:predicted protein [Botrytis cinerea T4]
MHFLNLSVLVSGQLGEIRLTVQITECAVNREVLKKRNGLPNFDFL